MEGSVQGFLEGLPTAEEGMQARGWQKPQRKAFGCVTWPILSEMRRANRQPK